MERHCTNCDKEDECPMSWRNVPCQYWEEVQPPSGIPIVLILLAFWATLAGVFFAFWKMFDK